MTRAEALQIQLKGDPVFYNGKKWQIHCLCLPRDTNHWMYLTISENGIIKETAKVCFDDFEFGIVE
jgi:hypothetical protein